MSSASRTSGTRLRTKFRSRDCSCSTMSEMRRFCSCPIVVRLAASVIYIEDERGLRILYCRGPNKGWVRAGKPQSRQSKKKVALRRLYDLVAGGGVEPPAL